jgi:hypothetical protein
MSGLVPWKSDPIRPEEPRPLRLTVDGETVEGLQGQSIAGVLLARGATAWRTTVAGRPRGVFCGIGVCFDCIATVNGESDVRLCLRRACEGDTVETQNDAGEVPSDAAASRSDEVGSRDDKAGSRNGAAHHRGAVDTRTDTGEVPSGAAGSRDDTAGSRDGAAEDHRSAGESRSAATGQEES